VAELLLPSRQHLIIVLEEGEDWERAYRIAKAAVLTINDKAPLFDGPAPLNTNRFDVNNYKEE
jgi:hypothetical protein